MNMSVFPAVSIKICNKQTHSAQIITLTDVSQINTISDAVSAYENDITRAVINYLNSGCKIPSRYKIIFMTPDNSYIIRIRRCQNNNT